MPAKTTTKKNLLQPISAKTRRNLLTPPPKEIQIGKSSLLEYDDINEDKELEEQESGTRTIQEPKQEQRQGQEQGQEQKEKKIEEQRQGQRQGQGQETSNYHIRLVSVENVLATYGYKTMEKLVVDNVIQYIRCTNNNGHIVFVDMKNSDYTDIENVSSENVVQLKLALSGEMLDYITDDIKTRSYGCVETDLNGIMLMYHQFYLTLIRNDHILEPKETIYARVDGKILRSTSEELIPFPIVSFEDIIEDHNMVDEYVYNVTGRVCTLLYTDRENGIHQMVDNINKLSKDTAEYYDSIIEKINFNSDAIYKLETFKDTFDKMQGNLSKDDRARLRLILFNLRVVNNIERENIKALGILQSLNDTVNDVSDKLAIARREYETLIKNLTDQVEEFS